MLADKTRKQPPWPGHVMASSSAIVPWSAGWMEHVLPFHGMQLLPGCATWHRTSPMLSHMRILWGISILEEAAAREVPVWYRARENMTP